ncbi:hypothetical protein [Moraxella lacunata]|uniref:hypothetical protein n=1 Tax=Moraxella lacunata TaxID=477 RepID=UPI003EDF7D43
MVVKIDWCEAYPLTTPNFSFTIDFYFCNYRTMTQLPFLPTVLTDKAHTLSATICICYPKLGVAS